MKCFPHPSAKLILHSTHVSIREKFLSTNVKEDWTKIQVPKFVRLISTGKKKKNNSDSFCVLYESECPVTRWSFPWELQQGREERKRKCLGFF